MTYTEELDDTIIEPITLEETKDYLGIPQSNTRDDAFLERLITSMRSYLEDMLGRNIVLRQVRYRTQYIDGPYHLRPFVESVDIVTFEIYDYQLHDWITKDTMDYDYEGGEDATVYAHFPRGSRNITIDYTSGFNDIPEAIKMALLDMVKMKYERNTNDPFDAVRPMVQSYRVETL